MVQSVYYTSKPSNHAYTHQMIFFTWIIVGFFSLIFTQKYDKQMWTSIFLLFCFASIGYGQTNCRTTAWWVLQPFSKSILEPFLSKSKEKLTFNSANPLAKFMGKDQHPVYLEFNQQNNCEQSSLPPWLANLTSQTFVEFKLEIPYLLREQQSILLKPLIYQNNLVDVSASHIVYGLPAYFATMLADFKNNTYSISYLQGSIRASFQPLIPALLPFGSRKTANFSSFVDANISPWLAFPYDRISSRAKCASNIYNFAQPAYIRPVRMTLNVTGNILGTIPAGIYTNAGNQPLGAWQIDVNTTITSTYPCP